MNESGIDFDKARALPAAQQAEGFLVPTTPTGQDAVEAAVQSGKVRVFRPVTRKGSHEPLRWAPAIKQA